MLKIALYFNIGFYGLISVLLCISSFSKNDMTDWAVIAGVLLVLAVINLSLVGKCIDFGWDFIFIIPIFIATEVLYIITIIRCNLAGELKSDSPQLIIVLVMILVPALLFAVTYAHDVYRLNSCDYLLQFHYHSGIVISEETFLAVTNHKPAKVTLINNPFKRETKKKYQDTLLIQCSIDFSNKDEKKIKLYTDELGEYEAVFNEIGNAIIEENPKITYVEIKYIPEENDAIVLIKDFGNYLYHDNKRVGKIKAVGSLEKITVLQ